MKIATIAFTACLTLALVACKKKEDAPPADPAPAAKPTENAAAEPAAEPPADPAADTAAAAPAGETLEVNVPAKFATACADVWKAAGDFSSLNHPAIAKTEATGKEVGATRVLTLAGEGGTIKETLEKLDNEAMVLQYRINESPLPVDDYVGTISLTAEGDKVCAFNWSAKFKAKGAPAADAQKVIEGIFQAGVAEMAKAFGTPE